MGIKSVDTVDACKYKIKGAILSLNKMILLELNSLGCKGGRSFSLMSVSYEWTFCFPSELTQCYERTVHP